jgi:D-proline reductase (dithiol) PrdB
VALRYLDLAHAVTSSLPPLPVPEMGEPALMPLDRPLRESRVMIVSSAGVHLTSDEPFRPTNDMSYRRIPQAAAPESLKPSHPAPVRRPGEQDVNVVHPYLRLAELADEGFIGGVTDFHLSVLGAIKKLTELVTDMAPAMADTAKAAGADLVLLVPLCPACHQAVGLMARVLEREGLPTVCLTGARDITERIRPPRSAFLNFPLGNSAGAPGDPRGQREVLRAALQTVEYRLPAGTTVDLPFEWPDPNWEAECMALYHREADTVLAQRLKSEYEGDDNYALRECNDVCSLI